MIPYFSALNYKDSDYQQDNGFIHGIQVTGDDPTYDIKVDGLVTGFSIPYTSSIGFPDLDNLVPDTYRLTVRDSSGDIDTLDIVIAELAQVVLSVNLSNSACESSGLCDCELTVTSFIHNSTSFNYEVFDSNNVSVGTYTASTGSEVHIFTGLCLSSYTVIATELDYTIYNYNNPYNCDEGTVVITPAVILTSWSRFCFYAPVQVVTGQFIKLDLLTGKPISNLRYFDPFTNLQPNYFWDHVTYPDPLFPLDTNPYRLAPYAAVLKDGIDSGPSGSSTYQWYLNTNTGNYVVKLPISGTGWVTYKPTQDRQGEIPTQGNPTARETLTGTAQWGLSTITPGQVTIDSFGIVIPAPAGQMVECYQNSEFYNGFYSNCGYRNYTHEVTMGSSNQDDDEIGIVLASFKDVTGKYGSKDFTHSLIFINYNGNSVAPPTFGIYYNAGSSIEGFKDPNDLSEASTLVVNNRQTSGSLQPGIYFIFNGYVPGDDFSNVVWADINGVFQPLGTPPPGTPSGGTYFIINTLQTPTTWNGTVVHRKSPFTLGNTTNNGRGYSYVGYAKFRIIKNNNIITVEATPRGMSPNKGLVDVHSVTIGNNGYTDGVYVIPVVDPAPPIGHVQGSIQITVIGGIILENNILVLSTGANYSSPGQLVVAIDISLIPFTPGLAASISMRIMNGDKVLGDSNPYELFFTLDLEDPSTWLNAPSYATSGTDISNPNRTALEKFNIEPVRIGYLTASQLKTQFFDIDFTGDQTNTIDDTITGNAGTDTVNISSPQVCYTITDCSNPSNTKIVHVTNLLINENLYPGKIYRFSLSEQEYICWRVDPAPGCPPESIPTTRLEEFNNCEECILEVRQCFDLVACPNTCDNILNINSFDFTPYIGGQVILNGDSSCIYEPFAIREAYFINVNTDTLSPLTSPLQTGTNLVIDVESLVFNTVEQITGAQPQYVLTAANYNPTYCVGYNCSSVLPNTTENGFSNIPTFLDNLFQTLGIRLEAYVTSPNFCQIGENNQFFKIQYRDGDTFFLSLKITYGSFVGIITITNTGNISEQTITIGKETTTFELCNTDLYCTAEDSDEITASVWNEGCPQAPIELGESCNIIPRIWEPGFSTKNCDPNKLIDIKCNYAEAVYILFKSLKYGIKTCCEMDLDKADIKNMLVDLGELHDPEMCIVTTLEQSCCIAPCNVVVTILVPSGITCPAPVNPVVS